MKYTLFKPDYLLSISGGDKEIMEDIVGIFKSQIPEFLEGMETLLDGKQYHELGLLAHKAKGSVSVMGLEETGKMLKEFELLARTGEKSDRYQEYIHRFTDDCMRAMDEINDYLGKQQ